jgi:hypothetical protein
MFELIAVAIYQNLMHVESGSVNLCTGSCASLCIIDVSRAYIVKNILEITGAE